MFSSNIKACDISRFDLFQEIDGSIVQWSNQNVEMIKKNETSETQIKISTLEGFRSRVFVYSFVKDKRADTGLELDFTVCGREELLASTNSPQVYHETVT